MCGFVGPAETGLEPLLHEFRKLELDFYYTYVKSAEINLLFHFPLLFVFCQLKNHLNILNKKMNRHLLYPSVP